MDRKKLISLITKKVAFDFEYIAIQLFQYQYKHNIIYRNWVNNINIDPNDVVTLAEIPFLPISAFKNSKVQSGKMKEESIFISSGTTGSIPSKHYVFDDTLYLNNAKNIFESFYGPTGEFCFLALLPSYLERSGSSLVAMVNHFIDQSAYSESGFYLYNHDELYERLISCREKKIPTILFGVSFALLDFVDNKNIEFPELIIIETGGMKGRKKEVTRDILHDQISNGFGVPAVHSEYGMTELFSQAYAKYDGTYTPGATMRIFINDITDPFQRIDDGKTGVVNIIDLANIDSCAFIETQDIGRKNMDGTFEILGRLDVSDIRGCNLMVESE